MPSKNACRGFAGVSLYTMTTVSFLNFSWRNMILEAYRYIDLLVLTGRMDRHVQLHPLERIPKDLWHLECLERGWMLWILQMHYSVEFAPALA